MCVSISTLSKSQRRRPLRDCSSEFSVASEPLPMQLVAVKCFTHLRAMRCFN
jgi:hypothetical protein